MLTVDEWKEQINVKQIVYLHVFYCIMPGIKLRVIFGRSPAATTPLDRRRSKGKPPLSNPKSTRRGNGFRLDAALTRARGGKGAGRSR